MSVAVFVRARLNKQTLFELIRVAAMGDLGKNISPYQLLHHMDPPKSKQNVKMIDNNPNCQNQLRKHYKYSDTHPKVKQNVTNIDNNSNYQNQLRKHYKYTETVDG